MHTEQTETFRCKKREKILQVHHLRLAHKQYHSTVYRFLLHSRNPFLITAETESGFNQRRKDKRPLSFCWNGFSMFVLPRSPRPLPESWLGVRGTRSGGSMGGIKGRVFLSSGRSLKRLCYDILHVFTAFFLVSMWPSFFFSRLK